MAKDERGPSARERRAASDRERVNRVRITIFDYGAGNLHSLAKTLERDGVEVRVETDPARAVDSDALVLPGVGA